MFVRCSSFATLKIELLLSFVVHEFTCPGCGASYVQKKERMLYEKCVEHDGVIKTVLWKITSISLLKCYTYLKVTSTTKQHLLKMCHLRHRFRIFLFQRKVMLHSPDIQVCIFNHPIIYQISDVMMSISIWNESIFKYIFWTTPHYPTKFGQLIDITKGNNFFEKFWMISRTGNKF